MVEADSYRHQRDTRLPCMPRFGRPQRHPTLPVRDNVAAAERWFHRRGLPWFVEPVDERVRLFLSRRRLWIPLVAALLVACAAAGVGWLCSPIGPRPCCLGRLAVAGC